MFYRLLILDQKNRLLNEADNIYSDFLTKAKERFKAGDVDVIELSTAENQRLQIANQQQMLATDYNVLLEHFQSLLNTGTKTEPVADSIVYPFREIADVPDLYNTPMLKLYRQRILVSEQQKKLENARLLPTFSVGYNSTTIIGWQTFGINTEKYYGSDKRFESFNAGIGIPLFYGAQRAKIVAADRQIKQREQELAAVKQQLNTDLAGAIKTYTQRKKSAAVYRSTMLPNATTIISAANTKLSLGEISYLEWTLLINQALQIRNEYFTTIEQMNEAAFEIERISAIN